MHFTYNYGLVIVSIAVAIVGSFIGLVLTTDINTVKKSQRRVRLLVAALALGGSIWSMHFIAMLAVRMPVRLNYEPNETAASAAIAIVFTAIAFAIVGLRKRDRWTLPIAGCVMGLAIGSMHYLGMDAIRGCGTSYDLFGVALSVAIALQAAGIALWIAFAKRGIPSTVLASIGLGLGIASMHYSGMRATEFRPAGADSELLNGVVNEFELAVAVMIVIWSVWALALFIFTFFEFRKTSPT